MQIIVIFLDEQITSCVMKNVCWIVWELFFFFMIVFMSTSYVLRRENLNTQPETVVEIKA